MDPKKLIDPDWVVLVWVTTGIEDFFLSFRMRNSVGLSRYDPFINAMGLELICKGYLLAIKRSEYEGLGEKQAIEKVKKLAKKMGHKMVALIEEISKIIGQDKVRPILDKKRGRFTGAQILEAIEAAYLECRYPLSPNPLYKKFPVKGGFYVDPVCLSELHEFCYKFSKIILTDLKTKFGIGIPEDWWNQKITGNEGRKFENCFCFDSRKEVFISQN